MPNESSGKDLQIMSGHFYVRSLLHGVICVTKCQRPSNCFFLLRCWLSSCFAIAIRVDVRESFGGSISITAQCIETQLMPNESSRKDLQIICWSLLRQISPSWCNLRHKVSTSVKLFLLMFFFLSFFFFLLAAFGQIVRKVFQRNCR